MSAEENDLRIENEVSINKKFDDLVRSKFGLSALAVISLVESSLPVPILTDPFLATSILVNRANATKIVLITTVSSVLGGVLAYYLAFFAFDFLGNLLSPELMSEFHNLVDTNTYSTLALTLVGAITPVPYTIVAWVVGVLEGNPLVFIIGSILGRGLRYSIVGYSAYKFGPMAIKYARKYIALTSVLVFILILLFFWLKM